MGGSDETAARLARRRHPDAGRRHGRYPSALPAEPTATDGVPRGRRGGHAATSRSWADGRGAGADPLAVVEDGALRPQRPTSSWRSGRRYNSRRHRDDRARVRDPRGPLRPGPGAGCGLACAAAITLPLRPTSERRRAPGVRRAAADRATVRVRAAACRGRAGASGHGGRPASAPCVAQPTSGDRGSPLWAVASC